jgi:predicted TIM-barrel enzyme
VNKDAIILVHGGPVAMPEDAEFVLKNTTTCHGFYGASSMERLPTEVAMTEPDPRSSASSKRLRRKKTLFLEGTEQDDRT